MNQEKNDRLLTALQAACKGLVFISETEAPLTPFVWNDDAPLNADRLLQAAGTVKGTPIEAMELSAFFRAVPKEMRSRYDALNKVLQENLTGIKVYKVGEVNLRVFIVGKAKDGSLAGVATEVVET
jgi:hypothetical protein